MKHLKRFSQINESISRYDFGLHVNHSEIDEFIYSNTDAIDITDNEEILIKEILGSNFTITRHTNYSVIKNKYSYRLIGIHPFGDYCYGLSIGSYEGYSFVYEELYIIDDFDGLLERLKIEIGKQQ